MRMKRILAMALCTLLTTTVCLTLLPSVALAAQASSVSVGGLTLNNGQFLSPGGITTTQPADHYAGFSTAGGVATLTLCNFTWNHTADCIKVDSGDITLRLIGANTITATPGYSINCSGNLIISGPGSISFKGENQGITVYGNLTVDGATVRGVSGAGASNIISGGHLTIKNSGHVTVSGCNVYCITVTNSDLEANSSYINIQSRTDSSEFTNSTVTDTTISGITVEGNLTIDNTVVTAKSITTSNPLVVRNGSDITVDSRVAAEDISVDASDVTINGSSVNDYALTCRDNPSGGGNGSVSITNGSHVTASGGGGIFAQNGFTVTGSTVEATASGKSFYGIRSEGGNIAFTNSTVTAEALDSGAIYANGALTISSGTVTATTKSGQALFSRDKITISGGVVNATSNGGSAGYGISTPAGSSHTLSISGGTITAKGAAAGVAAGNTIITGGTLTTYGDEAFHTYDTTSILLTIGFAEDGRGLLGRSSGTPGETGWSAVQVEYEATANEKVALTTRSFLSNPSARISDARPISGTVKDAAGNPVSGASILIDGLVRGSVTTASGEYKIYAENGAHTIAAEKGAQMGSARVTVSDAPLTGQDITLGGISMPHVTVTPAATFQQGDTPNNLTLHIGSAGHPPNGASHFGRLEISGNGASFAAVDRANYTLTFGSIHIALKQSYLNTLTPGVYTLHIYLSGVFAGPPLTAHITVTAPDGDASGADADVPKTGDDTPVVLLCGLVLLSGAGLAVSAAVRRRKRAE